VFNEADLSFINQHRGSANRLGLAVQLCYLRFPGIVLGVDETPFPALLKLAADQLGMSVDSWSDYGRREQTRREHLVELQKWLRLSPFGLAEHRRSVYQLTELAQQSDRGIVLAEARSSRCCDNSVLFCRQSMSLNVYAAKRSRSVCAECMRR
jgi:hypothetical protein